MNAGAVAAGGCRTTRITSIDALRGLVMLTMIFVNDLASAGAMVPDWMMHYELRHPDANGMTFVDLVFPAFLFIVGMAIPFALGSRMDKGEPIWRTHLHVLQRTVSLWFIGVLMVNGEPDSQALGWAPGVWVVLMLFAATCAFGSSQWLRRVGCIALLYLSTVWVGPSDEKLLTLAPFQIRTQWWGILGLIGWDYWVGSMAFILFKGNRTALFGCMVVLLSLFAAEQEGVFDGWALAKVVGIGDTLGAQAAITVGGVLLASLLVDPARGSVMARVRFTLLFISGSCAGALLLQGTYGINKNAATPSYCLWACAVTAALWLLLYFATDVRRLAAIATPLSLAGQNVLLAYFLSESLPSVLTVLHLSDFYHSLSQPSLAAAITRSVGCSAAILAITIGINMKGFRLKL